MRDQAVFVLGLVEPTAGPPREMRRFRARWRVDGRDRKRTFKAKSEAERFRARLQHATIDGEVFDLDSGLLSAWSTSQETWWTWSRSWLGLKWPRWSGNSRRSGVESLVSITPHMVRRGAPAPPPDLAHWLRNTGFDLSSDIETDDPTAR